MSDWDMSICNKLWYRIHGMPQGNVSDMWKNSKPSHSVKKMHYVLDTTTMKK